MPDLDLAPVLRQLLISGPAAVAIITGAALLNVVLTRGLRLLARRTSFEAHHLIPARRLGRSLINVGALVLLLGTLGLNLGGIWAMLATVVGMLAIGFVAVWSVLSNMLCTVIILICRPFEVGDEIEFTGEPVLGKVADLNFIYTTLRAADGGLIQVPNNLFLQRIIKRRRGNCRISLAQQLGAEEPACLP
ncbi:MAG: mechanosensitive ion channel domain-containing protein [Deltaproteobacteria bacterium]